MYEDTHHKTGPHYLKRDCPICHAEISSRGFAYVSHGRAHVRRGEAKAVLDVGGYWDFVKTEIMPVQKTWADWCCPHPDCHPEAEDRTRYNEPPNRRRTVCNTGHQIRLVWRDGSIHARIQGRYRHQWAPWGKRWLCPRCGDKETGTRLPVFGCIDDLKHEG